MTTVIGLLPLALGGSYVGGLFYNPLARTVMGGLISSAVLTPLVLPNLTLAIEAIAAWLRRVWRSSAPHRRVDAGRSETAPSFSK